MKRCRQSEAIKTLLLAAVAAFVTACKPTVPKEYIQPDDMEDILYDFYVSKAMASRGDNYGYDRMLYYTATLKKHGVSEAEYDSSLVYYYTHADKLSKIYKSLSERIGDKAKQLGASVSEGEYANLSANGDTANVWRDATTAVLMPVPPYNRIDFTLKADTTYRRGDSFLLKFTSNFIYQSGTKSATAYVAVTYKGDSVVVSQTRVSYSGMAQLRIPANDEADIKDIRGFIYLSKGKEESSVQKLMFIDGIQLIRFHKTETPANADNDGAKPDSTGNRTKPDTIGSKLKPTPRGLMKVKKIEPVRLNGK